MENRHRGTAPLRCLYFSSVAYLYKYFDVQTDHNLKTQYTLDLDSDEQGFDQIYVNHYPALFQYAFTLVNDDVMAEEMVHQVFLKILEKNEPLMIRISLKSYLFRAVHNECLNYFKHQKVKQVHVTYADRHTAENSEPASGKLQLRELERQLHAAINELPEQCRTIFQMSRFEELKYAEIALQLGISIKTVENQISKALKRLRRQLAEYLPLIILFFLISITFKR